MKNFAKESYLVPVARRLLCLLNCAPRVKTLQQTAMHLCGRKRLAKFCQVAVNEFYTVVTESEIL